MYQVEANTRWGLYYEERLPEGLHKDKEYWPRTVDNGRTKTEWGGLTEPTRRGRRVQVNSESCGT